MGFDREEFESTPLYDESLCSVLYSSQKTGLLITGCLGRVIIWKNDGTTEWISPLFDENSYVTHITLLEPSDDPRPFFYLWIASQVYLVSFFLLNLSNLEYLSKVSHKIS